MGVFSFRLSNGRVRIDQGEVGTQMNVIAPSGIKGNTRHRHPMPDPIALFLLPDTRQVRLRTSNPYLARVSGMARMKTRSHSLVSSESRSQGTR